MGNRFVELLKNLREKSLGDEANQNVSIQVFLSLPSPLRLDGDGFVGSVFESFDGKCQSVDGDLSLPSDGIDFSSPSRVDQTGGFVRIFVAQVSPSSTNGHQPVLDDQSVDVAILFSVVERSLPSLPSGDVVSTRLRASVPFSSHSF